MLYAAIYVRICEESHCTAKLCYEKFAWINDWLGINCACQFWRHNGGTISHWVIDASLRHWMLLQTRHICTCPWCFFIFHFACAIEMEITTCIASHWRSEWDRMHGMRDSPLCYVDSFGTEMRQLASMAVLEARFWLCENVMCLCIV